MTANFISMLVVQTMHFNIIPVLFCRNTVENTYQLYPLCGFTDVVYLYTFGNDE